MVKDFAFMFMPGDYLRDTQCLSSDAQVAYDRIMCEHMRNICITYEQHKFFTKRLTAEQREELNHVLKKIEGGYQIEWVANSIEKRIAYSESRRKNREGKENNISISYDSHMEDEDEYKDEDININAIKEIFDFWKIELNHPKTKLDSKTKKSIQDRLKEGYSIERIKEAIVNIKNIPHNMGQNDRNTVYDSLELICRSGANVDRFAETKIKTKYEQAVNRMSKMTIADLERPKNE